MARAIELNAEEEQLFNKCEIYINNIRKIFTSRIPSEQEKTPRLCREMALIAHKLHMSLENRGIEIRHSKSMLENRRVSPKEVEFYNNIHSVEDLLKFICDPDSNNDLEEIN